MTSLSQPLREAIEQYLESLPLAATDDQVYAQASRLHPNIGSPSQWKRRLREARRRLKVQKRSRLYGSFAGSLELLRIGQIARLLRVSRWTIARRCAAGDFPRPVFQFGRVRQWRASDVLAWCERHERSDP